MTQLNRRKLLQRSLLLALPGILNSLPAALAANPPATTGEQSVDNTCNPLLNHQPRPLMSPDVQSLCDQHAGKVLLFVNTASKCGFTPQFEALETLNQRYSDKGFAVLGFPSDDFRQELSTEAEVAEFCQLNYGVTFPMFQKINVSAPNAHPLYKDLAKATGRYPNWNFNKYLVDRKGVPVQHYGSGTQPLADQIVEAIEALL